MSKQIAILGSTGSIGTQALEVVSEYPDSFEVYALTAHRNVELLIEQAKKYMPDTVIIADESYYPRLKDALKDLPIKTFAGAKAIEDVVQASPVDLVLTAMVGYAGLKPTIQALKAGKDIALANKETMVVAGEIINRLAKENQAVILPVDSEHSAIFQCLELQNPLEKVILTASGGPFRKFSMDQLQHVTKEQALKHPNWSMGAKITIDSASMMNKGFEVIEAKWLFGLDSKCIDVVVHPQSIVHSMVQFKDGSVKAQLGLPDMKLPILYAFTYPYRFATDYKRVDFPLIGQLEFERPDQEKFRNLALAYEAMEKGGNMPCILNAANEIAVASFLQDKISFLGMSDMIAYTMAHASFIMQPDYEDYVQTDAQARRIASEYLKTI
ncbi:MAG: 1-deoxy-D-xylulose-5-phosphate reductoisomerase [Bacteroidales bacterium]|nr:1-deoxy-D-xylulose-5-phosphate reductoisomerase [Bacteroidales bacterium]